MDSLRVRNAPESFLAVWALMMSLRQGPCYRAIAPSIKRGAPPTVSAAEERFSAKRDGSFFGSHSANSCCGFGAGVGAVPTW